MTGTDVTAAVAALRETMPDAVAFAMLDVSWQGQARVSMLCASSATGLVAFNPHSSRDTVTAAFADLESAVLDQLSTRSFRITLRSRSRRTLTLEGPVASVRELARILAAGGIEVVGVDEVRLMDEEAHDPSVVADPADLLAPVLVVTTETVPGHVITKVLGLVTGATVRSRNVLADAGAEFKSLFGGELGGMTKMVIASRDAAEDRLRETARGLGANAVVGVRFDTEQVGPSSSPASAVVAYGTAVRVAAAPADKAALGLSPPASP